MQRAFGIVRVVLMIAVCMAISSCATKDKTQPASVIPAFGDSTVSSNISEIRYAALKETATSLGAQGGLAWRSKQINNLLETNDQNLNRIFNFRALLLSNNVIPPVLAEGENNLNLDDPDALRLADRVYKIVSPPRFVTAPPTWRDYLWMNFKAPDKPDVSLLPKNAEERNIWNQYVTIGWSEGTQQANQIFSANLGRLKRDYQGMIIYRILLAQNMVTAPFVAKTDLGITGNANEMRINDQVLRITATSKLQTNAKVWKPALVTSRPGAK